MIFLALHTSSCTENSFLLIKPEAQLIQPGEYLLPSDTEPSEINYSFLSLFADTVQASHSLWGWLSLNHADWQPDCEGGG